MDIDDRIKDIKMGRHFPDMEPQYCQLCGAKLPYSWDYYYENEGDLICVGCILRRVDSFKENEVPDEPIPVKGTCGYCFKKKKLIGKWCHACRNEKWRREVKVLLEKKILSGEEEMTLEYYRQQSSLKKEFK